MLLKKLWQKFYSSKKMSDAMHRNNMNSTHDFVRVEVLIKSLLFSSASII